MYGAINCQTASLMKALELRDVATPRLSHLKRCRIQWKRRDYLNLIHLVKTLGMLLGNTKVNCVSRLSGFALRPS
jgi:hypothetical protein